MKKEPRRAGWHFPETDREHLESMRDQTTDPLQRYRCEVDIDRNTKREFELEHKKGMVSISLARVGVGGYSFSYATHRDPVADRVEQASRILERIVRLWVLTPLTG